MLIYPSLESSWITAKFTDLLLEVYIHDQIKKLMIIKLIIQILMDEIVLKIKPNIVYSYFFVDALHSRSSIL